MATAPKPTTALTTWRPTRTSNTTAEILPQAGCGDVPFDLLTWLAAVAEAPLVFVPGNHDPDLSGYRQTRRGLVLRAGLPVESPWPAGAINVDGRVVDVAGLRVAGLG